MSRVASTRVQTGRCGHLEIIQRGGLHTRREFAGYPHLDETDRVHLQRNVPCELGAVLELLERFDPKPEVVVESTFNWYWLVDGLMDHGFSVVLAHVLGLAMITAAKVKTDKRYALTLARLLRLGAIPKAHIYPREQRGARDLLRRRMILVRLRASEYAAFALPLWRTRPHASKHQAPH